MNTFRSVVIIALATLVLVSSTSFVVGMHFCSGELENIAFLTEAAACKKEQSVPACHRHEKPSCCEDRTVLHEGDDFKSSVLDLSLHTVEAESAGAPTLISEVIPSTLSGFRSLDVYHPPLRTMDLTVVHQIFLI